MPREKKFGDVGENAGVSWLDGRGGANDAAKRGKYLPTVRRGRDEMER
jgi:hypothetical protein